MPTPLRRGPKPKYRLQEVVDAAIAIADAEGLHAVTMQRVGEALGATKMALYRYLPGKTELAALMLDRALGPPPATFSAIRGADWRSQLSTWALELHTRMAARPWSLELTLGVRTPGLNELLWFERGLAAMSKTPLDGAERLDVLALLNNHVRGCVQIAASASEAESALATALEPLLAAHAERFCETRAAFASAATSGRRNDALRFGLERILDGVATLIASRCGDDLSGSQRDQPGMPDQ